MIDTVTIGLERHAEAIYADVSRVFGHETVKEVFLDMIRVGDPGRGDEDTKRIRLRHEFSPRKWALIEQLAGQDRQARLVTIGASKIDGEATSEIIHEALLRGWKRLRSWLADDRAFRLWLQRTEELANEWRQERYNSDLLLSGRCLEVGEDWMNGRSSEDLETVRDFLDELFGFTVTAPHTSLENKSGKLTNRTNVVLRKLGVSERAVLYGPYGVAIVVTIIAVLATNFQVSLHDLFIYLTSAIKLLPDIFVIVIFSRNFSPFIILRPILAVNYGDSGAPGEAGAIQPVEVRPE